MTKYLLLPLFMAFTSLSQGQENMLKLPPVPEGAEVAVLGAGCFWCVEAVYSQLDGVLGVTSGYSGGHVKNPTYEQVCGKDTGHVEVVRMVFDPKVISYNKVLDWFWKLHDPTQADGQGHDRGPQYMSVIFCQTPGQKAIAENSKKEAQIHFSKPIVTDIRDKAEFYPAEVSHQRYYELNKNRNPYCRAVILPKMEKLGLEK